MAKRQSLRKPRPKLDLDVIVDAAIARVEHHGLDELSARKLARDLGCEAMSLYHHVGSMEALKDAMVDKLLGSISPSTSSEPAEALDQETEAYLDLAERHARAFQLVATRRWKGKRAAATAGRAVANFIALGFDATGALARARALGAYLNGAGLALAAWATDLHADADDARKVKADLRDGLNILLRSLVKAG